MAEKATSNQPVLKPELWFSTPIWSHQVPDHEPINQDILAVMHLLEADSESLNKSNVGGWHSHRQLHQCEEIAHIRQAIGSGCVRCARALAFDFDSFELAINGMWLIRNGPGDLNKAHIHPNTMLSGVYYVQTPPDCGKIEFFDPVMARTATAYPKTEHRRINANAAAYEPVEGLLLIFPSWLQHWVRPNRGVGDRVSISFNVGFQPIIRDTESKD